MSSGLTISELANSGSGSKGFGSEFRTRDPDGMSRPIMGHGERRMGKGAQADNVSSLLAEMDIDAWDAAQQEAAEAYDPYSEHTSNTDDALFQDENPHESVIDVLSENSNVDFEPKADNVEDNTIDCSKAETHAQIKSDTVNDYMADTEEKMEQLTEFWNDHQAVAQEYLEMAYDNLADEIGLTEGGITKGSVVRQIMPQAETGKGSAAAQTAVPGAIALDVAASVNDQRTDLTRDQKRALIEETVRIAQSRPALDGERLAERLTPGSNLEEIQDNLARLSSSKMEMLLTQRAEDQPEYEALQDTLDRCIAVKENQFYARDHYHENVTMDKVYALAETGNNVVNFALNDSTEIRFNATQMNFAGDFLRSASLGDGAEPVTAQNAQIDTSQMASVLNEQRLAVHLPQIQNEMHAYMQRAIT